MYYLKSNSITSITQMHATKKATTRGSELVQLHFSYYQKLKKKKKNLTIEAFDPTKMPRFENTSLEWTRQRDS